VCRNVMWSGKFARGQEERVSFYILSKGIGVFWDQCGAIGREGTSEVSE